jgi:multiple antibiotic resistance protein
MDILFYAFVTLFVVIDPIGTAAVFATMTRTVDATQRRHMARRATWLAGAILFAFAIIGEGLLGALGVSLSAFRIAGGLMLFLLAVDMVFARPSGLRSTTAAEKQESEHREDITVFPLAFPLIAGPGAMTSVVLLIGRSGGHLTANLGVLGVLVLVLAIQLALLLAAGRLQRLLGVTGSNVISRVFGIILAALAVQFVMDGTLHGLRELLITLKN